MITYLDFAVDLAKRSGAVMKANFLLGMKKEWKGDNTPVTETDIAINNMVIQAVGETYPDHSVLAEEGDSENKNTEYTWVCDPVDGTIPFSHGVPTSVFSLALVQDGVPIIGIIYDPFMDRMYVGEKGKGARLNNNVIRVSNKNTFNGALIGTALLHGLGFDLMTVGRKLQNQGAKIFNCYSITYEGALVACGEFVATLFNWPGPHDTAAMKVIIEEAGGKVTDLFGNEQRYDGPIKGHVASNGILHDKLIQVVQEGIRR